LEQVLCSYDVADSSLPLDEEVEVGVEGTVMDRELEVAGEHEEQLEVPSPRVLDKKAMDRELEVAGEQKERLEVPYPRVLDKKAMLTRIRRVWVAAVMTHEHSQRVSETLYVAAILPVCFESELQWLAFVEAFGEELISVVCFLGMLPLKVSLIVSLELGDWPLPA
jgi:hypothetical protein